MAHPQHQSVRQRYQYHCGYCGVSEVDAGGELTVDHFQPVSAGGDNDDNNLVYACVRCNLYKSDFYPNAVRLARGHRLLHPLLDNIAANIHLNELTGLLEPLTVTGNFHIGLLQLNRPALAEHRRRKFRDALVLQVLQEAQQENTDLRAENRAQAKYIALLYQIFGLAYNDDA